MSINKREKLYIFYSVAFAFVYFIFIMPWIIRTFDGKNIFFQFLAFNLGLIIFLQLFLKSVLTGKKIQMITAIGLSFLFVGLDVITPPYAVNIDGSLATGTMNLVSSSSDYLGGAIGQNILGIHGGTNFLGVFYGWNYLFTYILFSMILLLVAGLLLKDLVRHV